MPKICRHCGQYFSFAQNGRNHEVNCPMRYEPLGQSIPGTCPDAVIKGVKEFIERQSPQPDSVTVQTVQCAHCGQHFTKAGFEAHARSGCSTRYTMTTSPTIMQHISQPSMAYEPKPATHDEVHKTSAINAIPENTPQTYAVELKQVAWTACYQTSQGLQVCGGFDTVAFDVGKGFTKQSWLTLEASLRNQPGNSHLFNFRLMAAQILDS